MPKFKWSKWDFDCDGEAYIIRKDLCPNREDVPKWIVETDNLDPTCLGTNSVELNVDEVKSGWCKYQVRTDWDNGDGEPMGGYCVYGEGYHEHLDLYGKRKRGWFEVWIVRVGEWY